MTDRQEQPATLVAPLVIEYPFTRTTGAITGAFLTGLREKMLVGSRGSDGRVHVPPVESDPVTGQDVTEVVEVGQTGEVTTWAWVNEPHPKHPLDHPFAWALVRLDGADTPMLHVVDAGSIESMHTGLRVEARWRDETEGAIGDLACFVPVTTSDGGVQR